MITLLSAWMGLTDTGRALFRLGLSVATLLAVLGVMVYNAIDIAASLNLLTAKVQQLTVYMQSAPVGVAFDRVNRFFPLAEFLALVAGWLALYSIALVVRVIRSFIPTVGG